jgi:hypothetical protein
MEEPMDDPEEVKLPEDVVEDLAPDEAESKGVQGGVYDFYKKVDGGGG